MSVLAQFLGGGLLVVVPMVAGYVIGIREGRNRQLSDIATAIRATPTGSRPS